MATQTIQQENERQSRQKDDSQDQDKSSRASNRRDNDDDSSGGHGVMGTVHSAMDSPVLRNWILPGLVSIICGVAGAAAYWYFTGSGNSGSGSGGDSSSSSGGSGSSNSSGSSKNSGSSKGSKTSKGAMSSEGSDSSEASDLGKKARKSEHADSGKGSNSSKGSDSGEGSESSQSSSGGSEIQQVESAWKAALKEVRQAQESEKAARQSEEHTKAILDFLRRSLLSAGRPDGSLTAAFWSEGKGKDVTLRKAVDITEARVAEAFQDRPLSEASVRELLGWAYLSLSDAPKAVTEYERAFALREAVQGDNHGDTAACRNQLAVAYRMANRFDDASRLFDRNPSSPAYAAALAVRGAMLLMEKKPAQAELKLRASLTTRQKNQPDDWTTFDTMSMLGQALLDQRKFAEAEPLLIEGYEGLQKRKDSIPPQDAPRITKALERIVNLYEAWGQEDKAIKWRQQLQTASPTVRG